MEDSVVILFLSANPTDQTQLRLSEEAREIENGLLMTDHGRDFEFRNRGSS